MSEDQTNPVDVEDEFLDAPEVEVEAEETADVDAEETEGQADEAQPEDDTEEIDHDGKKFKVPKELKDAFLRQADYTRKTQEVAETRKALEAQAQSLAQQAELAQVTLENRTNLKLVEQQLAQFQNTDWQAYAAAYGADATAAAMVSMQQYKDAQAELKAAISQAETEHRQISERTSANAIAQAEVALAREIEGWGNELVSTLASYAATEFGISPQELKESVVNPDGTADTRTFKVLARLHKAETRVKDLEAKLNKTTAATKQAAVTPAKAVGQRAGGYEPGVNDKLPMEEWMRRRNAQVAKTHAR
ncbi:MAG: hypothetical protein IM650_11410 [Phenylobacterium sp.]|uniref:hypothetical protein n=1 Tax=Phenylobacterium sp. TaxID=1871053 RepID=UPI0025D54813|nr:hypothetical protein [Phenylobacterium sp.]MCA3704190.1 hypothetical protein [Methylobacterium sp.]MCA6258688.1 hypothetical protein [Phenylobacterium sp.]MCA6269943.1 hypothetical protein [Phenylobacterium sp.]MCA6300356.1 hypothetical protein [Phenylobacterium sp.]MCA6307289.1 hypothetical protein [Phenylobacterium sp.]